MIFVYSLLMHFNINKLASFQLSFSFNMFIIFIDLFIDQFFSWNNFQWNTKKIFKMVIILKVLDYINYKFLYEEIYYYSGSRKFLFIWKLIFSTSCFQVKNGMMVSNLWIVFVMHFYFMCSRTWFHYGIYIE